MDDREELDRLLGETERPTLSPDGQWRADYRRAQRQRRLAGAQPDLFGGPTVEHFHRNPTPPDPEDWPLDYEITRFQDLTLEEQASQLAADPHTPWARSTRKKLTPEERAAMIAATWPSPRVSAWPSMPVPAGPGSITARSPSLPTR